MHEEDIDPEAAIEKYGYKTTDVSDLPAIVQKVFDDNPDPVQKILDGNDKVKGFLVGQIMKATKGQAPPQEVNRLIDEVIESLSH